MIHFANYRLCKIESTYFERVNTALKYYIVRILCKTILLISAFKFFTKGIEFFTSKTITSIRNK